MIERLWESLRRSTTAVQQRVDATHPLDLYADFEPPDRPSLLLLTTKRPPVARPAKSVTLQTGRQQDGRWALRATGADGDYVAFLERFRSWLTHPSAPSAAAARTGRLGG